MAKNGCFGGPDPETDNAQERVRCGNALLRVVTRIPSQLHHFWGVRDRSVSVPPVACPYGVIRGGSKRACLPRRRTDPIGPLWSDGFRGVFSGMFPREMLPPPRGLPRWEGSVSRTGGRGKARGHTWEMGMLRDSIGARAQGRLLPTDPTRGARRCALSVCVLTRPTLKQGHRSD